MILSHSALSAPMPATMMFLPAFTRLLTGASHCTPVTPSSCFFWVLKSGRVNNLLSFWLSHSSHLWGLSGGLSVWFILFQVHINCSKTDPFRQGCLIYLGHGSSSRCPISAIPAFLTLQLSLSGPFFQHQDGSLLTPQFLSSFIQSRQSAAGIQGRFSTHHICIGAATPAAQMSLPGHLIKTLGQWSSDSYQLYVQTPVSTLASVSGRLAT